MRHKIILLVAMLAGCAAPPPAPENRGPPIELAGRSAGPRQGCVPLRQNESLRVSETNPNVLIYGDGRTIYANFLGQCRFGSDDLLVTEPSAGSYCRGDVVRSASRASGFPGPTCILSDFVPFTH